VSPLPVVVPSKSDMDEGAQRTSCPRCGALVSLPLDVCGRCGFTLIETPARVTDPVMAPRRRLAVGAALLVGVVLAAALRTGDERETLRGATTPISGEELERRLEVKLTTEVRASVTARCPNGRFGPREELAECRVRLPNGIVATSLVRPTRTGVQIP
jgi:hypothetical protein